MNVRIEQEGRLRIVTIDRPEARNAVDGATAGELHRAFSDFDRDDTADVAVLTGAGGVFCAGADLKAMGTDRVNAVHRDMTKPGPLGCTRMSLSKPVIAAVEGHAVAGGLELSLWADMRVASETAVFGVFCRRWGVPLIDGGTVRLPRLIGQSRAMDMILTGRPVDASEAHQWGLANRVSPAGEARRVAVELGKQLSELPQLCLRSDRQSANAGVGLPLAEATAEETRLGIDVLRDSSFLDGPKRFAAGAGRHGAGTSSTE